MKARSNFYTTQRIFMMEIREFEWLCIAIYHSDFYSYYDNDCINKHHFGQQISILDSGCLFDSEFRCFLSNLMDRYGITNHAYLIYLTSSNIICLVNSDPIKFIDRNRVFWQGFLLLKNNDYICRCVGCFIYVCIHLLL